MLAVHDNSPLAQTVLAQLKLDYPSLKIVNFAPQDVNQLLSEGNVLLVILEYQSTQYEQFKMLVKQHRKAVETDYPSDVLLITDTEAGFVGLLDESEKLFVDGLIWPEPSGLLKTRLAMLSQLQLLRIELAQTRHSLAWHATRIDREHQLVEHIFRNALSRNFLDYNHIRTYLTPVSKFNGDLCLVAPGPIGNVYVFMADFTGHGLAPATGALPLSQAFFAMADRGVSVAEMVTEFNFRLNRLLPDDMFCAGFLLEISANGERVTYWNGGMPPAILFNDKGEIIERLSAQHMALGVLDEDDFDSRVTTFRASHDQHIALYTDGVIELLGHQLEFLGIDSLEQLLRRFPKSDDFQRLVAELEHFRGTQPLHDDLSLAILACQPTGLDDIPVPTEDSAMPFQLLVDLEVEHIRELDPVNHVLTAIGSLPGLRRHRTTLYLLLAEAYNNALEHGLLALDSSLKDSSDGFAEYYQQRSLRLRELSKGKISIAVRFDATSRQLEFTVTDSGKGWAAEDYEQRSNKASHGRGLDLLRQLTTQLRWTQSGRQVSFTYSL